MTYFFETYGCQMNVAESAAAQETLRQRGWTAASSAETADLAVINTCSVRATAESRIYGRLGWYAGLKAVRSRKPAAKPSSYPQAARRAQSGAPPLTLVVMGCMAERLLSSLQSDFPLIDHTLGTWRKDRIGEIAAALETPVCHTVTAQAADTERVYQFPAVSHTGGVSAFVPIMHGCDNFCTYCIVPQVRGREVSRPPGAILAELDVLARRGVREITVLGQNVNSYRHGGLTFPGLLEKIAAHLRQSGSSIGWVRFLTSHPKDFSPALVDTLCREPLLCRHIHLPVQHGSTKILTAMNRRYSREDYLGIAARIRGSLPDASLSTDILVGFPGETDGDFQETLDLVRQARFSEAYMYYYNPRAGTPAASMPEQVPLEVKKARLQMVIDLQMGILREEMAKHIGAEVTVLAEEVSQNRKNKMESPAIRGKTAQNQRVIFPGSESVVNNFVKIHLTGLTGNTFRGKVNER
ncbi:MAG: tRNA (N6-isopentenyl adenosine(37)-C2)-methylthiotransferase MiaB [Spirochaetaceae bacterium]|jgi:tRNA-2-methylthio-N6-dimethylallyladenosine synthase|nr:tRNA (N6-isopentenyl adenosine(37)-C2)-methylthiotransferase MiaB [Spirochaetaceae bacterium]